jgi:cell division protein FtsW
MKKGSIDYYLLLVTLILVVCGLIMVFSSSYYMAQASEDYNYDGLGLFKKQLVGAALGFAGLIFFMLFDYRKLMKARYFFLIAAVVLLVIVFIPGVGVELNGSSRWIRFGPLPSIQPSEIAKFAMIIFTASTIYVNRNRMNTFRYGIMPNLLVLGVFCVLLFLQPNYSSIILMCILVFVMMFVGGAKGWHLAALGGAGGLAGFGLMLTEDYRIDRLLSFTDPWKYASDGGFQVIQSLYGIGAGGIMGRGLGNGRQKYLWLPYSESDFIFSITTEELGLIGAVILIVLYIILVYRGIKIAANAPDMFGTMLATGITTVIGMQVIINIGVVTASIPATGVPLPFLSYGNWSLMIMLCMVGILLSISRQTRRIKMAEERAGAMETGY